MLRVALHITLSESGEIWDAFRYCNGNQIDVSHMVVTSEEKKWLPIQVGALTGHRRGSQRGKNQIKAGHNHCLLPCFRGELFTQKQHVKQ